MRISDWSSDVCSSDLINPLADWDKSRLDAYFAEHDLPRHPLEAEGYLSIGCAPCTSVVKPGEDPRAGRWRGWDKVECGIHGSGGDESALPVFSRAAPRRRPVRSRPPGLSESSSPIGRASCRERGCP